MNYRIITKSAREYAEQFDIPLLGAIPNDPAIDFDISYAETLDGLLIGEPGDAKYLCDELGIKPELREEGLTTCTIGFSEKLNKWFGWSHRAICGFTIGSKVSKGDVAYVPTDLEDARETAIRYWSDSAKKVTAIDHIDEQGNFCFMIKINEPATFLLTYYPPEKYGNGEWTAKTMEDAKQMAIDYARAIS